MNTIDLHIHTNKSDGKLSPEDVIKRAKNNGMKTISITDHDTIDAYGENIDELAKELGIKLIRGVEISTKSNKCGIHVLGYNINIYDTEFKKRLERLRNARHIYLKDVSVILEKLGYKVNVKKLDKIDAVTKAHIALDVIENKENMNRLISAFGKIPSKGDFIETMMNEGCIAYVKKETCNPEQAAKIIRDAGGKVVLAHPVAYEYEDNLSDEEILSIISSIHADGIEADYIYIDRKDNKINEILKWSKIANKLNKFVTIGSDFHVNDGLHPDIGLIGENVELNSRNLKALNEIF